MTGVNTFSGGVAIAAGTLAAAATGTNKALGSITSVAISNGGTLLLGNSNQVNAAATMTLGSATGSGTATFNAATYSQGTSTTAGFGALTLAATSKIDFGSGSSGNFVHFASSSAATWTGGSILYIDDYAGKEVVTGGTVIAGNGDSLLFGTSSSGLTTAQLAEIEFVNPTGYTGNFAAGIDSTGLVFAEVPEPATLLGGALMVGVLGWSQRRSMRGLFAGRRSALNA